jgi:MYXO-CTERM domain-containing protein
MTADPFFHPNPDLPDVDLTNANAQRLVLCNGDEVWTLPDGRQVYAPGGAWPSFDDEMPWEEDVEEIGNAGAPIGLVDNSTLIDDKLFAHNCMYDWPSPEACGNPPGGTTGDTDGSSATVGDATAGDAGTSGTDSAGADGGDTSSSCACRAGSRPAGALGGLLMLALGLQLRRRTDRRDA